MILADKQFQFDGQSYTFTLKRPYRAAFGLGEKFDRVNQKGNTVRACVREKCFEQGEFTYLSMPFFVTPDGFGLYVDTYVEVVFDFGEDEITVRFAPDQGTRPVVCLWEGSMKEILFAFREFVGKPRLFPKWVLGAWMSANRWKTQAEAQEQLDKAEQTGIPHSVLVLEPWSDLSTHYLWNGSLCPPKKGDEYASYDELDFSQSAFWQDPKAMVERMHESGVKVLLWVVPIYAQGSAIETDWNVAQRLSDNEYVRAQKECVMNQDGTPYEIPHTWCIDCMVPDFTNATAKTHWFNHFRHLKEIGIDGFKTDGGEFIHDKTVCFQDGTTGLQGQNAYPEQYTRAFAEFVGEEGIVFSRAGGQRSPCFSVIWAGDQESTWAEFRAVIKAGISAGLSGVNCWGYDIAGFSGYLPSRALYLRAVQTAAFLPVMQWHSEPVSNKRCDFTGAWQINDRSPWNMAAYWQDDSLLQLCRESFLLHYNLMPYLYLLLIESHETGLAPVRHLAMEFPKDDRTLAVEDQFMLGDALLVVPVLEDYTTERAALLPGEETWFALLTGEQFSPGHKVLSLTDRYTPVFMRNNSCLPLNLAEGRLCSPVGNRTDKYCELTFWVSGEGEKRFRDDLGNDIVLRWNRHTHICEKNKQDITFAVKHMEDMTC